MSEITVSPMDDSTVRALVHEGEDVTEHHVTVPPGFLDQLGLVDADPLAVGREVIAFLLDRLTADAIPAEVSAYDLAREHDDFTDELLTRLGR